MAVSTGRPASASSWTWLPICIAAVASILQSTGFPGTAYGEDPAGNRPPMISAGAAQLFVDLHHVEQLENIQRKFHAAEKHPQNPVFVKVKPWEDDRTIWGSVIYDPEEKIFKAWYGGKSGRKAVSIPSTGQVSDCSVLCYATSKDGVNWERPDLGLYEVMGTRANNVVINDDHHNGFDHWESILKDQQETDPERRYKALGWSSFDWDGPMSGIYTMTSPDGLHLKHTPEPIFRYHPRPGKNDLGGVGDAHSLLIDMRGKRYIAFLRTMPNRAFSVSTDFVTWTQPAMSLKARPDEEGNTIYNHMGFVYGDQYLGQLTYLHKADPTRTLVDIWLITSRDGTTWERPESLVPFMSTGEIGEWDRFSVHQSGAPPIRVGDRLYFYFRNIANRHKPYSGQDTTATGGGFGLATLRVDGFASLGAGYDGGQVTTKPFVFEGTTLQVNAKADSGQLTVEILDDLGQPLPGFTQDQSVPMVADSVAHVIKWRKNATLESIRNRPVRLRFYLKNVRLYSYQII